VSDAIRASLLKASLEAAVPLEIASMRELDGGLRRHLVERLRPLMQEGADEMLYGGPLCARAFAVYARALAVLAFQPGGVTFGGLHWCAAHLGMPWPAGHGVPCPHCLREEREVSCG
jgi:hypothetical protein